MKIAKRNSPILIIGLLIGIIFIVIIILGRDNKSGVSLTENFKSAFNVSQREIPEPTPAPETYPQDTASELVMEEPEELPPPPPQINYPILEIAFTEEGFDPISSNARTGQTVRWTNTTEETITIKELITKYEEFADGVTLNPSETFELLLDKYKIWTFKEMESGAIGKLTILEGTL